MINQGCASGSRLLYGIKDRQKVYMRSVALVALVVAAAGCQQTSGQTNAGGGGRGGRAGRGQTVGIETTTVQQMSVQREVDLSGTLPIALGLGAGAESRRPLGLAVVGGLVVSQLLTLYITPVYYVYIENARLWLTRRRPAKVRGSAEEPGAAPAVAMEADAT